MDKNNIYKARIFSQTKSAMQSGAADKNWWLEYGHDGGFNEDVMGWHGSTNTKKQIKLKFATKAEAIAYAESKSIPYDICESNKRQPKIKSYADNFK